MDSLKNITISEVLDDLNRGLTRSSDTPGYKPELGSIMEKYSLTKKELDYLFSHPKLKGRRTKLPVMFNLVDDTVPTEVQSVSGSLLAYAHYLSGVSQQDTPLTSVGLDILDMTQVEAPAAEPLMETSSVEPVTTTTNNDSW